MDTHSRLSPDPQHKVRPVTAAVVLAGTHVWESGGFDAFMPRSLVPVLNIPLVLHTLNWLGQAGISTIVLCVNQEGSRFRKIFGDGSALQMEIYYLEDHLPRGPAGCAFDATRTVDADRFVVVEANTIHLVDLNAMLASHRNSGEDGTVVVAQSAQNNAWESKEIRPAGIYVFERELLNKVPHCGYVDIKEWLIPELYRSGRCLHRFEADRYAPRVHDAASCLQINHWALNEITRTAPLSLSPSRRGAVLLDPNVQIAESVRIVGPCLIGRNSILKDGATIIGPAVVGRNCSIGAGALVQNCVMWDRAAVESGNIANGLIRADW